MEGHATDQTSAGPGNAGVRASVSKLFLTALLGMSAASSDHAESTALTQGYPSVTRPRPSVTVP